MSGRAESTEGPKRTKEFLRHWRFPGAADFLLLAVPVLALFPLRNDDLWWHLAAGRWIVEHGAVPHVDPFSFTGFMGAWIDNEWLPQVLFYGTWRVAGNVGLVLLGSLVYASIFLAVRAYLRAARNPSMLLPSLLVGIGLSYGWWGLRPSAFTLLGLLLLLIVVERGRRHPWRLAQLPALFLVWANVHPGFLLGLMILAGMAVASGVEGLRRGGAAVGRGLREGGRLGRCALASAAATLVNPYGWQVYAQQFSIAGNAPYRAVLDEWAPPSVAFLVLVLATLGIFLVLRFRKTPLPALVPIFGAAALSLTAVRFEEYFAVVAVPALFARLGPRRGLGARTALLAAVVVASVVVGLRAPLRGGLPDEGGTLVYTDAADPRLERRLEYNALILLGTTGFAFLIAFVGRRAWPVVVRSSWRGTLPTTAIVLPGLFVAALLLATREHPPLNIDVEPERYPAKCLAALPGGSARVFNRLSWGGWVYWKTGTPTYIDGRCWGQPIFFEYLRCNGPEWDAIFRERGIDWAIVSPAQGIARSLAASADWEKTCEEPAAVVYRRKAAGP